MKDWEAIQKTMRDAKHNKPIDYKTFKLKLDNLLAALGINENVFY